MNVQPRLSISLSVFSSIMAATLFASTPALGQSHSGNAPHGIPKPVEPAVAKKDLLFRGGHAHCYFEEKTLTWKLGNDVIERHIHFESDPGALRTESVKTLGGGPEIAMVAPNEGDLTIDTGGTSKTLRLDRDWAYTWQSVSTPDHGGRRLTIHLQGIRSNSGYEVEVIYELLPGNRPYLTKSFTLINRTGVPVALTGATYDRWILAGGSHGVRTASSGSTAAGANVQEITAPGGGMEVFVEGPNGKVVSTGGALVPQFTGPVVAAKAGGRATTPRSVVFAYSGAPSKANLIRARFNDAMSRFWNGAGMGK